MSIGGDYMIKPIKDFEDVYAITDKGEVVNLNTGNKTFGYLNKKGYLVFDFRRRGGKTVPIHRLVAKAFIPNPNNLPQVNHIDGNKTNNKLENLEWCTNGQNQKHAFANGLQKGNFQHHNSKLTQEEVIYIKNNYKYGCLGYGIRSLAKKFNVCDSTIKQIIRGQSYKDIN